MKFLLLWDFYFSVFFMKLGQTDHGRDAGTSYYYDFILSEVILAEYLNSN